MEPLKPGRLPEHSEKKVATPVSSKGGLLTKFFKGVYRILSFQAVAVYFASRAEKKRLVQELAPNNTRLAHLLETKTQEELDWIKDAAALAGKLENPSQVPRYILIGKSAQLFEEGIKEQDVKTLLSADPRWLASYNVALFAKQQGLDFAEKKLLDPKGMLDVEYVHRGLEILVGSRLSKEMGNELLDVLKQDSELAAGYASFLKDALTIHDKRPELPTKSESEALAGKWGELNGLLTRNTEKKGLIYLSREILQITVPWNRQIFQNALAALYTSEEKVDTRDRPFLSPQLYDTPYTLYKNYRIDPLVPATEEEVEIPQEIEIYFTNLQTMETRTVRVPIGLGSGKMAGSQLQDELKRVRENIRADEQALALGDFSHEGAWAKGLPDIKALLDEPKSADKAMRAAGLKHLFRLKDGRLSLLPIPLGAVNDPYFIAEEEAVEAMKTRDAGETTVKVAGKKTPLSWAKEIKKTKDDEPYQEITLTLENTSHRFIATEEQLAAPLRFEREVLLLKGEYYRRHHG